VAPLGEVEEPTAHFHVTSLDITGPYVTTSRGNKYLLTFIDHFTKYVEAFPVPDQTAETCARIYATQVVTRHGTGSQLITDQGRSFMSSFFQETCKILGIRTTRTTIYHPQSNGSIEKWHRSLHTALSHYINSANNNWDTLVPFFLMFYRATPNSNTGHSPFFLLHGREMEIPNNDNLKAQITSENPSQKRSLENLKASLKLAYKLVARAKQKSHQNNKRLYDRRATVRNFEENDLVYLYNPATKPGLTRKFHKPWAGPFKVIKKISDLNYKIVDQKNKQQVVHVNRMKRAYNSQIWKPKFEPRTKKRLQRETKKPTKQDEEEEFKFNSFPLVRTDDSSGTPEREPPPLQTPETTQSEVDAPCSERKDPSYEPSETPKSRREFQTTRTEPPITRSRARIMSHDSVN